MGTMVVEVQIIVEPLPFSKKNIITPSIAANVILMSQRIFILSNTCSQMQALERTIQWVLPVYRAIRTQPNIPVYHSLLQRSQIPCITAITYRMERYGIQRDTGYRIIRSLHAYTATMTLNTMQRRWEDHLYGKVTMPSIQASIQAHGAAPATIAVIPMGEEHMRI